MGLHNHFSPLPSEDKTLSNQALYVNFCLYLMNIIDIILQFNRTNA